MPSGTRLRHLQTDRLVLRRHRAKNLHLESSDRQSNGQCDERLLQRAAALRRRTSSGAPQGHLRAQFLQNVHSRSALVALLHVTNCSLNGGDVLGVCVCIRMVDFPECDQFLQTLSTVLCDSRNGEAMKCVQIVTSNRHVSIWPRETGIFLTDNLLRRRVKTGQIWKFACGVRAASISLRIFSLGFSSTTVVCGATLCVSQTLEPMTASWPTTVLPPRIVALA